MSIPPVVVVNKTGFWTALVKGLSGTIITVVVCGAALGLYGTRLTERAFQVAGQRVLDAVPGVVRSLEGWRSLPPALVDALNDRRDVDYKAQVDISTEVRLAGIDPQRDDGVVVVTVANNGPEIVTSLTIRLLVEDEGRESVAVLLSAATPVGGRPSWGPGPLLPGTTRRIPRAFVEIVGAPTVTVELTELRVWNGPVTLTAEQAESRAAVVVESDAKATRFHSSPD